MSQGTKIISRIVIILLGLFTLGSIAFIAFWAFVMAIPGSSNGNEFLGQAAGIILMVGFILLFLLGAGFRFVWRIKVH